MPTFDNNDPSLGPLNPGADPRRVRPVLPEVSGTRTIFIVGPCHLYLDAQDTIDEAGFVRFAMVSRDGMFMIKFGVLPNDDMSHGDLWRLAYKSGNDLMLENYISIMLNTYKGGYRGGRKDNR